MAPWQPPQAEVLTLDLAHLASFLLFLIIMSGMMSSDGSDAKYTFDFFWQASRRVVRAKL